MAEYSKPTGGIISSNTQRPSATETVEGKAEIATQAEIDAATDDTRFITPLKLGKGQPNGVPSLAGDGKIPSSQLPESSSLIISSTQWEKTLPAPVNLPNGSTANGFTFFDDATDRVANGCTSYNEYFISFTRKLTLTGNNGSANINVDGVDYLATYNTSLTQTATDFVTTHSAAILAASGVKVASVGAELRFGDSSTTILDTITITNVTTNLNGTFIASIGDHVAIPYVGEPYEGLRILHQFRVSFGIAVGSTQTLALSLRRWTDDSVIGSEIPILRNADEPGKQFNFISYTAGASDPFVTGGFYFALRNDSGTSIMDIEGTVGILIHNTFQKPVNF